MNHFETQNIEIATTPPSPSHTSTGAGAMVANVSCSDRVLELELENSRLQQLIAELLIKNHQLRKSE
ncbi:MAG: hypothetical protein JWP98_901 [Edaphobacter sp.]|nr:hypothetical protein [Edaphobacter sp.]